MKKYLIIIIILMYPYLQLNATSYARPEKKRIFSENKKYYVLINPETNIHEVYNSENTKKILWSFEKEAWRSTWVISNDGEKVVWISWKYVRIDDIDKPCIMIYNSKGIEETFSYNKISSPRKYKIREVGPIGSFWRVWYESISEKSDGLVINVSGRESVFVSKINGSVKI